MELARAVEGCGLIILVENDQKIVLSEHGDTPATRNGDDAPAKQSVGHVWMERHTVDSLLAEPTKSKRKKKEKRNKSRNYG
jgi:hypothetical protein